MLKKNKAKRNKSDKFTGNNREKFYSVKLEMKNVSSTTIISHFGAPILFSPTIDELRAPQQKRFYIRGTLKFMMISQLTKIPTINRDWLRSLAYVKG